MILANMACCQAALGNHDQAMSNFRKAHNLTSTTTVSAGEKSYLTSKLK
jgi:hypothetical protein